MITGYYPEMNEAKPENMDGTITRSSWAGHWYVTLFNAEIKGRGIEDRRTDSKGHNTYCVTNKVKDQLCKKYNFSCAILLD